MVMICIAGNVLLVAALLAGCSEQPAPTTPEDQGLSFDAAASLTIVIDPIGDVKNNAPAWLDLSSASVSKQGTRFLFTWDLAAPVPSDPTADPAIPAHSDHVCLGDGLDTDPTSAPVGFPFGKNEANFAEFYVAVCWSPTGSFGLGTGFLGLLIDRRPLLGSGQAVIVPVEFSIQGTHVSMVVGDAALGHPETFAWAAFTEVANQADPIDAAKFPDFAPDASFAIWP